MTENLKKILKYLTGIILAGLFLYLSLKGKDFAAIWQRIKNANTVYLLLSVVSYLLTFVARSEKWRIQVENLNFDVTSKASYFAIMMHYYFNAFTPKLGIIARCTEIKSKAKVPVSSCFGSVFSEAVFDTLSLLIAIIFVLAFQFEKIATLLSDFFRDLSSKIHINPLVWLISIIILLALFFLLKKKKVHQKNSIRTFISAVGKTFKLKKMGLFLFWNLVVWIFLLLFNLFLFKSLSTFHVNFNIILTITVFTYFGWLMPTPGGIGSVEYFVLQAFLLFGLNEHLAVSFGILSNGLTFLSIIITGFVLIILDKAFKLFH